MTPEPLQLEEHARHFGFTRILRPASRAELVDAVRDLAAHGEPFCPIGSGHTLGWGAPPGARVLLSTAEIRSMTRFAPEDLTCGVAPGMPLGELGRTLAASGLTLEPGPFPDGRTIGGVLAEAPPSPRGFDRAALRSQLIGIAAVDGSGRTFKAGGNVVKNVAGYDLAKLYVGSGGAYFVATELQLRLVPLPESAVWLRSQPVPRSDAAAEWLRMRSRCRDARALDLVLLPDGSASIEMLLAGPARFVERLAAREPHGRLEAADAWNRVVSPLAPGADDIVMRGHAAPASVPDLVRSLPRSAAGRVHFQGAFLLQVDRGTAPRFPPGTIARGIWNGPGPALPWAGLAHRLKQAFGGNLCPGRLSFDTESPA